MGIVCFSGKLRKLEDVYNFLLYIFFEVINFFFFGKADNKNYFIIVNSSFILLLVVFDGMRMLIK